MKKENKKALYEMIMRNVSKQVKNVLNEKISGTIKNDVFKNLSYMISEDPAEYCDQFTETIREFCNDIYMTPDAELGRMFKDAVEEGLMMIEEQGPQY